MATSNESNMHRGGMASWAGQSSTGVDCAPRVARGFHKQTARVLVVSPSSFVRMALVQRLLDVVSPRVRLVLTENLADAAAEPFDLMVVGPYLSPAERAQAGELHAGRSGAALIELADSPQGDVVRVLRAGRGGVASLTDVVRDALVPVSTHTTSHGGMDA
jgi:hypothetical protein